MKVSVRPRYLYFPVRKPSEARRQRGNVGADHARIRNQNHVRPQQLFVGFTKLLEARRTDFLLALEDKFHVRAEIPRPESRLEALHLHHALPLIVVGAARIDFPVADSGFEGVAEPQFQRLDRHHVVVGIYQHRWQILSRAVLAIYHRIAGSLHHLGTLCAGSEEQFRPAGGTFQHLRLVFYLRADGLDANQRAQFVHEPLLIRLDIISYLHKV